MSNSVLPNLDATCDSSAPRKVGIVAGWGNFPVEVALQLKQAGCEVHTVGIKGHASKALEALSDHFASMGVLRLGGHMRFFRRHDVRHVVLAGKLFKEKILYHGRGWLDHFPDLVCIQTFSRSFVTRSRDTRDDTLLQAIVQQYENRGINIMSINQVAPSLLAQEGVITRRQPNRHQKLDIEFGWSIARQMGRLDVGQSITVQNQNVLAVEAIEGTDALIQRTAALCPRGGFTLVKAPKPGQDMRFDVPTIGLRTVEQLHRAGGRAIAIEAGRTIFVDRAATIELANRLGIAIVALPMADDESSNSSTEKSDSTGLPTNHSRAHSTLAIESATTSRAA